MFEGFSPETFDFLWGIRMNNNKDWFTQHKAEYVKYLYEPMKALGQELFEPFRDIPGTVGKVSRIYRDARMHPPEPYKESLWICIRQDVQWWGENPCLYFEITPEGVSYGFFIWKPGTAAWEAFRRHIAARPEEFLALVEQTEQAVGSPITADTYKRPKPCEDPRLERFYSWKGQIGIVRDLAPGEALFTPELKSEVADFFQKLTPLYNYFNQFKT